MDPWKVRSSITLVERAWLTVRQEHVVLPTGHEIEEFHVIQGPDWVGVLAFTEQGDVLVVDQYRHGIQATSRELPAGVIEPGETPLDAARRELLEETGYVAEDWLQLIRFATEPSRHTTIAWFFVARGARRAGEQQLDDSEHLSVACVTADELFAQIDDGHIHHATHIAAIALAARRGLFPASQKTRSAPA